MGVSYKAYWLTDIPTKRFAEVAVNALNRYGWKIGMVNDEVGSVTANKSDSKDVMGKWWKFEFRARPEVDILSRRAKHPVRPRSHARTCSKRNEAVRP